MKSLKYVLTHEIETTSESLDKGKPLMSLNVNHFSLYEALQTNYGWKIYTATRAGLNQ